MRPGMTRRVSRSETTSPAGAAEAASAAERAAGGLQGTVAQVIADLAGIARWLPGVSRQDADRAGLLLTALAAECAEAASICRAIGTSQERPR